MPEVVGVGLGVGIGFDVGAGLDGADDDLQRVNPLTDKYLESGLNEEA
jgi:hypothetical protein